MSVVRICVFMVGVADCIYFSALLLFLLRRIIQRHCFPATWVLYTAQQHSIPSCRPASQYFGPKRRVDTFVSIHSKRFEAVNG